MSKFLLNHLGQISKAFIYSKIQILFRNNSPQLSAHPAFRPSHGLFFLFQPADFPSPSHWASASRPAQPTITAQTSCRLLPPTPKPSTAPPPAGLMPPPRSPRRRHRKRKMAASNSPSFPPHYSAPFPPSSIPETGPSTPPLKLLQAGN
jgi:hypothetical protein